MINNASMNGSQVNSTLTHTGRRGTVGPAKVVLQTATALSLLGPRRAMPGGRSKPRLAGGVAERGALPVAVERRVAGGNKRSAVRVRESAGTGPRTAAGGDEIASRRLRAAPASSRKKGKKTGRAQQGRPASGRTGAASSAGSRRKQRRSEALDDFTLVAGRASGGAQHRKNDPAVSHGRDSRGQGHAACSGTPVALGQHNFSRIHEDRDGCYRLAEDVVIHDELRLPVGNRTHPFTGSLDGNGHALRVQQVRDLGDAVLFGAISNSTISLSVVDSRLETRNGSLAAFVGEMQSHNRVQINRLDRSLFKATGVGRVEAALVGTTCGDDNHLELYNLRGNRVMAHARVGSGAQIPEAVASLGLGVVRSSGHQYISQRELKHNQVQALAEAGPPPAGENSPGGRATAALLGILGDPDADSLFLKSRQRALHENLVRARTQRQQDLPAAGAGFSCASLGYGSLACRPAFPEHPAAGQLAVMQTDCTDNSVQAWSCDNPVQMPGQQGAQEAVSAGLARASLVSTQALSLLYLGHRSVGPDQLVAHGTGAQRFLVAPAHNAVTYLTSGGDASLPLFPPGSPPYCRRANFQIDTAAYRASSYDCQLVAGTEVEQRSTSLSPAGWVGLYGSFRGFESWKFDGFACSPASIRYPHEDLQSLTPSNAGWLMVTRQRYPWQRENDLKGLMRVSRLLPLDGGAVPLAIGSSRGLGWESLHKPPAGSALPQTGRVLHSLVHNGRLYHLQQLPGQAVQLVTLNLAVYLHGQYQLAQYETLAGQARLLSFENGELNLWMQQESNDTVLVYGLGARPSSEQSPWLRTGFDLSDQPGGRALLARAGDWLYTVRQQEGQPSSLRRIDVGSGAMDVGWQQNLTANVTEDLRLVVDDQQLTLVPVTGTLVDPYAPAFGWQAQVPEVGGCLQWARVAVARHALVRPSSATAALPSDSNQVTASASLSPTLVSSVAPGHAGTHNHTTENRLTTAVAVPVAVGTAVATATACVYLLVWSKCRQRLALAEQEEQALLAGERALPQQNTASDAVFSAQRRLPTVEGAGAVDHPVSTTSL